MERVRAKRHVETPREEIAIEPHEDGFAYERGPRRHAPERFAAAAR
jgi:hypothetical protein